MTDVARANELDAQIFDLGVGMDLGWVGNLGSADEPAVQLQVMTREGRHPPTRPFALAWRLRAEVDAIHERVLAAGLEIVHPITNEDWGVRRLFFRDHDGNVVNVVAHC